MQPGSCIGFQIETLSFEVPTKSKSLQQQSNVQTEALRSDAPRGGRPGRVLVCDPPQPPPPPPPPPPPVGECPVPR